MTTMPKIAENPEYKNYASEIMGFFSRNCLKLGRKFVE